MLAEAREHLFLADRRSEFEIQHFTRDTAAGTDGARRHDGNVMPRFLQRRDLTDECGERAFLQRTVRREYRLCADLDDDFHV